MVMRPEPWGEALDARPRRRSRGRQADAAAPDRARARRAAVHARRWRASSPHEPWLAFACGRYEGIDERVLRRRRGADAGHAWSRSATTCSTAARWPCWRSSRRSPGCCPGVIGNAESLVEESHEDGLLEYPVYTKPPVWRGRDVPEVLLSGHHAAIARWRRDERLRRTAQRRPDLIAALDEQDLDAHDREVLARAGLGEGA